MFISLFTTSVINAGTGPCWEGYNDWLKHCRSHLPLWSGPANWAREL